MGDQLSEKSSVLEAILGFPFPRDNRLCTDFATHIRLQRSTETRISVSNVQVNNTTFTAENLKIFQER